MLTHMLLFQSAMVRPLWEEPAAPEVKPCEFVRLRAYRAPRESEAAGDSGKPSAPVARSH